MTTKTGTLTDFLLARIDEERALAEETLDAGHRRYSDSPWDYADVVGERTGYEPDDGWLMTSPVRVLAECEAKRKIVELHHPSGEGYTRGSTGEEWDACVLCQWDIDCDAPKADHQRGAGAWPCDTVKALALPYADHPDFRPEWRL